MAGCGGNRFFEVFLIIKETVIIHTPKGGGLTALTPRVSALWPNAPRNAVSMKKPMTGNLLCRQVEAFHMTRAFVVLALRE